MAAALKKPKIEFCDDGVTPKLDRSRHYGTVYCDGFLETKFVQDNINYDGRGIPVGYKPAATRGLETVPETLEEVVEERDQLLKQLAALAKRVEALEGNAKPAAAQAAPSRKESPHAGAAPRA